MGTYAMFAGVLVTRRQSNVQEMQQDALRHIQM